MKTWIKALRAIARDKADQTPRGPFTPAQRTERLLKRPGWQPMAVVVGNTVRLLIASPSARLTPYLAGLSRHALVNALRGGGIARLEICRLRPKGLGRVIDATAALEALKADPDELTKLIFLMPMPVKAATSDDGLGQMIELARLPFLQSFAGSIGKLAAQTAIPAAQPSPADWQSASEAVTALARQALVLFPHRLGKSLALLPVPAYFATTIGPLSPDPADLALAVSTGEVRVTLIGPQAALGIGVEPLAPGATEVFARCFYADPKRLLDLCQPVLARPGATGPLWKDAPVLPAPPAVQTVQRRRAVMLLASRLPELLPALKVLEGMDPVSDPLGYRLAPEAKIEPTARRRSVLFLNQCYYNFTYLAKSLRQRGWDAVSVSLADPKSAQAQLFHDVDVWLFNADPATMQNNINQYLTDNAGRFGIVHAYGKGTLAFSTYYYDVDSTHDRLPWDILDLKRQGVLLGYSHSGCLDMVSQSAFRRWSQGMCERCVWRDRPDICSDQGNLAWGWKVDALADLICIETEPTLDFKSSPRVFRDPMTFALDETVWREDLEIPDHLVRPREPHEVVVFHAMGNYRSRTKDGVNVKGTHAVLEAIERLRAEGLPVRLDFAQDVPSRDMRFLQVQADILVDQLNYGRYGASAREAMMLGRPVVGRVDKTEPDGRQPSRCIQETPIVPATEDSIYSVLRTLVLDADLRAKIGRESREHAVKWWSAPTLAETFETVYDTVRDTGRPPPSAF